MFFKEITPLMDKEFRVKFSYNSTSYISGIVYLSDKELFINYFHINPTIRGKGIGIQLLNNIIEFSKKTYNIDKVSLMDQSSRYRKPHNIYIKLGFIYDNNIDNSMTLKL